MTDAISRKSDLRHYVLNVPVSAHDIINQTYRVEAEIAVKILNMAEDAIVQAVIDVAREAGVTDLYLLDKKFVLDALLEKMARERGICE